MMRSKFRCSELELYSVHFLLTGFAMGSELARSIYLKIISFAVSIHTAEVILTTSRKDFSAAAYSLKFVHLFPTQSTAAFVLTCSPRLFPTFLFRLHLLSFLLMQMKMVRREKSNALLQIPKKRQQNATSRPFSAWKAKLLLVRLPTLLFWYVYLLILFPSSSIC